MDIDGVSDKGRNIDIDEVMEFERRIIGTTIAFHALDRYLNGKSEILLFCLATSWHCSSKPIFLPYLSIRSHISLSSVNE